MAGSKMTLTTTEKMRALRERGKSKTDASKLCPPYVWDGQDEEERPLSHKEMQAGVEAYRKQRGRPVGGDKESTTIRFDRDILAAFRAAGPGWQTRMNAALRDWLKKHSPT